MITFGRYYKMEKTKNITQPATWVERYADQLFKHAMSRVGDYDVAKDILQDTFLSALKNVASFRGELSEKNWLYLILKNKIIDYYRSKAKRQTSSLNEEITPTSDYFNEDEHWKESTMPQQWSVDYSQNIETKEFFAVFEKCKNKLSELQNAVFSLKYLDNIHSEEICKELNISSSNYWVLIHRAKLQIRQCLEINWFKQ